MLETFRGEILSLLKTCVDRREARVMLAQTQLRLTRDRSSDTHRDQFWMALLQDITSTQGE
jgi:hypothetical protein